MKKLWGKVGGFFTKKPVETPPSPLERLKEAVLSPDDIRSFEVEAESVMQEIKLPEPGEMSPATTVSDVWSEALTLPTEVEISGKMVQTVKDKSPKKSTSKKVAPYPRKPRNLW